MSDHLIQYFNLLELKPGASLEEIQMAYYMRLERITANPSLKEIEHQQRLKHAYSVLRQACDSRPQAKASSKVSRRALLGIVSGAAMVAAVAFLAMNNSGLQLMLNRFESGDVVRWRTEDLAYGKVVRYEPEHRFHAGEPAGAYEIRLVNSEETVWLSERVVAKGMMAMNP